MAVYASGGLVLPHAVHARHDRSISVLRACHPGTRVDLLGMVYRWVDYGPAVAPNMTTGDHDKLKTARVLWINGPGSAGTGKSTVAYTVAQILESQNKLGASFFCSRDDSECCDPKQIFPTIAYQLGLLCPQFRRVISALLKADPEIALSEIPLQIQNLLVEPLQAVGSDMPFCVVVIDALDECQDGGATSIILDSLAHFVTKLSPLKFLITSRPEPNIMQAFRLSALDEITQRFIMHQIEPHVVESDLENYLSAALLDIKSHYLCDDGWPAIGDIKTLVKLSSGLFIFAATAARFIQDEHHGNPQAQLAHILQGVSDGSSLPHHLLDQLYSQVLNQAFPTMSAELSSRLKLTLGFIVLLQEPLSLSGLANLMPLSVSMHVILQKLQSVIVVPENPNEPIRLIHPSFYEFLVDAARCKDSQFLIKPALQHTAMASACLDAMENLAGNPSRVDDHGALHSEVENLAMIVAQNIPDFWKYACLHWAYHLENALLSEDLLIKLQRFCLKRLVSWVEMCSLLGQLHGATVALKKVYNIIIVCVLVIFTGSLLTNHQI